MATETPTIPPTPTSYPVSCKIPSLRWAAIQRSLHLTDREAEIVQRLFDGLQEGDIGASLGISTHTVHTHLGRIYRKIGVRGLPGLMLRVFAVYVAAVEKAGDVLLEGNGHSLEPYLRLPDTQFMPQVRKTLDR